MHEIKKNSIHSNLALGILALYIAKIKKLDVGFDGGLDRKMMPELNSHMNERQQFPMAFRVHERQPKADRVL